MPRCADLADCGYDNRDSDLYCRKCHLPLLYTALAGRYVVEALLSKGGYAAVFRGVDQNLSRRIAIKVLLPSKTTPSEQEHFLREARIAAALDHPNIAPILDYGKVGSGPIVFLVMPLYTSGSLRTRLAQANGALPTNETVSDFHQLSSALYYAHTRPRPVIHRDIKPENILIHPEDSRLVITDFGIARALEPGARTGKTITVRGTVGYMAPEQAQGIVDPRSDQFGSAVVLYEMLTGYHPFDSMGSGPVIAPSRLNHDIPSALDAVVLRALLPRPEERFADMMEFLYMFNAALRPSGGLRAVSPGLQDSRNMPASRRMTNPSIPSVPIGGERGDSTGRQPAARIDTAAAREKCQEGDAHLQQQRYSQALQAYEEAVNLDANNSHAWNGKGTALYNQGQYRKAYEAYQRATRIEPDNPDVWVSTGLTLSRLQRHQQALTHFEHALTLNPTYVAAWIGKADAQLDLNMPEDAVASYTQALAYDSQSFQAWNGLGNARSFLRDYPGAVEAYSRALIVNPRSAVAWCNKAEALIHNRHFRAALDALNEATELDRSYTPAWSLKALVYDKLGNVQEAQKARKLAKPWGLPN